MNRLLIVCLTISTLSFVFCQDSNIQQTIDLLEDSRVKLISAFEKNNLLSVEWKLSPGKPAHVNFTIRLDNLVDEISDECLLHHDAESNMDTIELMSIYQLSKRHVIAEWKHSQAKHPVSYGTDTRKILIIDILYCKYVRNLTYPLSMNKVPKDLIVYYDGGFDVIMTGFACGAATNCRERFDIYGKKLFDVNFLPLKFTWMTWQPVSKKYRSKGLFMRGMNFEENSQTQVYLVNDEVKNLFNLRSRYRVISYSESEKWYVICGQDIYDVELVTCAQYHVSKDKVFEMQIPLSSEQMRFVGVRGLTKGGVLLFAMEGNSKLVVVEMIVGVKPKIQDYELKSQVRKNSDFVIQVNEPDRTFIVGYESDEPKHTIIVRTLDLPKNIRKN